MKRSDGIVELDSDFGKELGFTSDKFHGYLWLTGKTIIISFIVSLQEGKGNLSRLFNAIGGFGYKIEIPTPSVKMQQIAEKRGFKQKFVYDDSFKEHVEIWTNAF